MSRQRACASRVHQLTFARRGGKRRGAGRKPKGERALVPHSTRAVLASRFPVLVTLKLDAGHPSLRRARAHDVVLAALRASRDRHGVRAVHYSIQSNHIHALVEARDAVALSRGMQGLAVRLARALNRLWKRAGRLWADRYHSRILRTPREVRNALVYVLQNARKHGIWLPGLDPCSSASEFDGWRERRIVSVTTSHLPPVVPAVSWLLRIGWRRHGEISVTAAPA
jgi:putative transposase